jgi:antitoxin (DNA-binding transcriptional repressor) of toxin-antitoxin stability system
LSAIIEQVERGEEIVITKRGKAVARITSLSTARRAIGWPKIDAFRATLRKTRAGVSALRKADRF